MFNGWLRRFVFLFLVSCQTTETTNIRYFKGFFNIEGKQAHPVEIYVDTSRPILQINILTPFGGVLAGYLWRNKEHQVILPSKKQYFKQTRWPSDFPFQGLIQNPLWLYQALLQQWPKNWKCKEIKKLKKCSKNDFVIEWEKKTFQRDQIRINLKKEEFSSKLHPYKSPSRVSLDAKIPKGFQQIHKMNFFQ